LPVILSEAKNPRILLLSLLLPLLLPLQVFAVILSVAKDPEELNSPRPSGPFATYSVFAFAVSFYQTRESSFRPKLLTVSS
jgi:hypothetical protein